MENKGHTNLLKDEYVMLQQFYEDIDQKGLNIKNLYSANIHLNP